MYLSSSALKRLISSNYNTWIPAAMDYVWIQRMGVALKGWVVEKGGWSWVFIITAGCLPSPLTATQWSNSGCLCTPMTTASVQWPFLYSYSSHWVSVRAPCPCAFGPGVITAFSSYSPRLPHPSLLLPLIPPTPAPSSKPSVTTLLGSSFSCQDPGSYRIQSLTVLF